MLAGLEDIKQRQYEVGTEVTQSLAASFALSQDLLALQLRCEYRLFAIT